MSDHPNQVEQKLIEFATKTAETIQTQAGQIQAISHVLLIALVSMSEQNATFKRDFIERIKQVRSQMTDRPIDRFAKEYFEELVRFIDNPYNYSPQGDAAENRPNWFKGIITGGKEPSLQEQPPSEEEP